jgi:hypothetical protein
MVSTSNASMEGRFPTDPMSALRQTDISARPLPRTLRTQADSAKHVHRDFRYPLQAKCGLTVDPGEKNTEGTPTPPIATSQAATCGCQSVHQVSRMDGQAAAAVMGVRQHDARSLWHLFEDIIAPTWRKPKLRASRLDATRLQHAGQFGS